MVHGENGGVIDALAYESAKLRLSNSTSESPNSPNPPAARARWKARRPFD
jgi:hypothetical protein